MGLKLQDANHEYADIDCLRYNVCPSIQDQKQGVAVMFLRSCYMVATMLAHQETLFIEARIEDYNAITERRRDHTIQLEQAVQLSLER